MLQYSVNTVRVTIQLARYLLHLPIVEDVWLQVGEMAAVVEAVAGDPALPVGNKPELINNLPPQRSLVRSPSYPYFPLSGTLAK